jgi:hypothetical protein
VNIESSIGILHWCLGLAMALLGGIITFLEKLSSGHYKKLSWKGQLLRFILDIGTAGFVGSIVVLIAHKHGVSMEWTGVFGGIAGHSAARLLFLADNVLEKFFKAKARDFTG